MIQIVQDFVIPATYTLCPPELASPKATAGLLTIGLQESGFKDRRQLEQGRARGFWEFELATVRAVLQHPRTMHLSVPAIERLRYKQNVSLSMQAVGVYNAIAHNDILACFIARMLMYTIPRPLPGSADVEEAWQQYINTWRPGAYWDGTLEEQKQLREKWDRNHLEAWNRVRMAER